MPVSDTIRQFFQPLFEFYFDIIGIFTVVVFLIMFIVLWVRRTKSNHSCTLNDLLKGAIAFVGLISATPAIFICAIDPTFLADFDQASLYLAVAGASVLYVSFTGFVDQWSCKTQENDEKTINS